MHAMLLFREQNRLTAFRIEGLKDQCSKKSILLRQDSIEKRKLTLEILILVSALLLCEP